MLIVDSDLRTLICRYRLRWYLLSHLLTNRLELQLRVNIIQLFDWRSKLNRSISAWSRLVFWLLLGMRIDGLIRHLDNLITMLILIAFELIDMSLLDNWYFDIVIAVKLLITVRNVLLELIFLFYNSIAIYFILTYTIINQIVNFILLWL